MLFYRAALPLSRQTRSGRAALAPVAVAGWIGSVPGFVVAQPGGGGLGLALVLVLYPAARPAEPAEPAADIRETAAAGGIPPAGN
jgi:hypothetical protein